MNKIFKLHQQYNFFTLFTHLMYKKTYFKPSNFIYLSQFLKDSPSLMKNKPLLNIGIKINVLKNSYN